MPQAMQVFVLLFNAQTDNEGVHTVRIGDRDIVLLFENADDATRYGLMLEAQDFPSPTVEAIEDSEVIEFCESAGYEWKVVGENELEVPPAQNLEEKTWQSDGSQPTPQTPTTDPPETPEYSQDEFADIRRRLEGLL